jgi:dienelactone hydrolase
MMTRRDALALPLATLLPGGLHPRLAFAADDADPTRVFTGDKKPTDVRLGPPKTLNGYFPFRVPKTKEEWEARRKQVREQVLVANGLWPLPEKAPLNAVVHGKTERDGYTIEKVYFASTPGHYVCGNLYRPAKPDAAKLPGVLFAHGHWANGRFHDAGEKAAEASVKSGGEADRDRGRFFMQAIPVTLARLGFVVFQYDMVGYADSTAIPHREGFKDAAAELRLQSFMGLQTWNSVRALDFLAGLPDVDPKRLGMTGASGGGTQTFIMGAIDDRLAAAFPAVMVSTAMQGGCVCENCSLLRVDTGNIELAALFAPKPLAMSAANDWTKELITKGYPELRELYRLYGAEDKVQAKAWLEYPHNYNQHAREFMYGWFRKHLQGKDEAVKEPPFKPVPPKELSVFDEQHPRPKDELNAEKLREALAKASDEQLAKLFPKDAASLKEFKQVIGTALRATVNSEVPSASRLLTQMWTGTKDIEGHDLTGGSISRKRDSGPDSPTEGDAVPFVWHQNKNPVRWVIWLHPKGKSSLMENGKWHPAAKALIEKKSRIVAIDVLRNGEQVSDKPFPVDKNYAGYTYGYNRSLLAERVHDVLTAISWTDMTKIPVTLVGWGEMGPVAVLAKALAGDKVAKLAADMNQFRFEAIKDAADPMMLPGAAKYGGLAAVLALCAPDPVLVHNHAGTSSGKLSKAAYDAAGAADKYTRVHDKLDDLKVVEWLVK